MKLNNTHDWLGYSHPDYAESFAGVGNLKLLDNCQGWIIERAIGSDDHVDAMGLYPIFSCREWKALPADLEQLGDTGLVSLTLVTDPMMSEEQRGVFDSFEVSKPLKTHYISELDIPIKELVSKHHAYYTRRAARKIEVELVEDPITFLDEWYRLYSYLISKHQIVDMRSFSRQAFSRLLAMPGVFIFRAFHQNRTLGAQIIIMQGDTAFAHLAAFRDEGYDLGASYLLDWHALEYFKGSARYINWGGGRAAAFDKEDGLASYKRGWSSTTKISYLIGSVFDRPVYNQLCGSDASDPSTEYFPAYRADEFSPNKE